MFNEQTPTMGRDLMQLALDGTRQVTPLLQTKFDERNGIVSPDGRWLAYESNSSGPFEIYVRPFPNVGGGQWQSLDGGRADSRSGRGAARSCSISVADGTLLRVPVEASGAIVERRHADEAPRSALLCQRRHAAPAARMTCRQTVSAS